MCFDRAGKGVKVGNDGHGSKRPFLKYRNRIDFKVIFNVEVLETQSKIEEKF